MVQKDEVFKQTVKKKGVWDFKELYDFCFNWFVKENFNPVEENYTEKASDRGKEIILKWSPYRKVTDYFKFVIHVDWHILGMETIDAERDGKKIKTNKGEVKIVIKSDLVKDYESRWEDKPLWKFLRGIYDKHVIRTTIDQFEDRLIDKTVEFVTELKAFLDLN